MGRCKLPKVSSFYINVPDAAVPPTGVTVIAGLLPIAVNENK
jgi:hypothetical protein